MKKVIWGLLAIGTFSAFANDLYYSSGPLKGKSVEKNPGRIVEQKICFVGKGTRAQSSLYSILLIDSEKAYPFTSYDKVKDLIVFGFVDTKCTDEGESNADCRVIQKARRCLEGFRATTNRYH
jgi:hypothetical protein